MTTRYLLAPTRMMVSSLGYVWQPADDGGLFRDSCYRFKFRLGGGMEPIRNPLEAQVRAAVLLKEFGQHFVKRGELGLYRETDRRDYYTLLWTCPEMTDASSS